ncbi:hypothetical protein CANMA_000856 [Candida margitis]|uniref:uncharacterized protein n=1 Tax=Candida margitis TaxID=1775924 RepID=UPI0022273469|nr:uncharacterized protein CANMA_000856 [Candida margitis]KAI5970244.1 hypothetical protein CANMA_000856 [Candida margitis]
MSRDIPPQLRDKFNCITPAQIHQIYALRNADVSRIVPRFDYAKQCIITTPITIAPNVIHPEIKANCEKVDSDESPIAKVKTTTSIIGEIRSSFRCDRK